MLIKDLETGCVREYGKDCHDSLVISPDGRSLSYYNLQCGEGSRYGCFRFVMEDGEVPNDSQTPDAIHAECYFNIGGFPSAKQIRDEVIEKFNNKVDCLKEHYTDACNMCTKMECDVCAIDNIIEQLEQLKEQNK